MKSLEKLYKNPNAHCRPKAAFSVHLTAVVWGKKGKATAQCPDRTEAISEYNMGGVGGQCTIV